MNSTLYHFASLNDWANADTNQYVPESFASETFIHLCTAPQAREVYSRFFKDQRTLLLVISAQAIHADVRWEDLYGHGAFPHLYAPLALRHIRSTHSIDSQEELESVLGKGE
jgi:uncharacterized protein (DUF952 family)